ncbi:MAG: hypothetical protein ABSA97_12360 [Verrucomicrobiia bacterium]
MSEKPPVLNTPRLDLTLITSHDLEHSLLLTNRSLISTNGPRFNGDTPRVLVPVSPNENAVKLSFGVKNKSTGAVDNLELYVTLPKNIGVEYDDEYEWGKGVPFTNDKDSEQFKTMMWRFPRMLLAGDADHAPMIKFPMPQPTLMLQLPCVIVIASKEPPNRLFRFWLVLAQIPASVTNKQTVRVIERNQLILWPDGRFGASWE